MDSTAKTKGRGGACGGDDYGGVCAMAAAVAAAAAAAAAMRVEVMVMVVKSMR